MAETIEEIQSNYISELRSLLPTLEAWWSQLLERYGDNAWGRWPTGYSGHPLVLSVFRKYYFEIEVLNEKRASNWTEDDESVESEALWGEENDSDDFEFENQAEWLIINIPDEAPDLEELVNGLCFVPIGMESDEDPV